MSSTEEGGGAVGAVFTDKTVINKNTNNDSLGIDMRCTDVNFSIRDLENLLLFDKSSDGGQPTLTAQPLIRKVPSTLRRNEDFNKYFKPKVISIGPLHHDDPTLQESEELKLKLAARFVKKIGVHKESLYRNMKVEIDGLKKCYDTQELWKYSNDELAWMFFVDGCAILQAVYMRYGYDDDDDGKLFIKNDLLAFVYSDLFLLENQLPFPVLELLSSSSKNGEKFMNAIKRLIDNTVITPAGNSEWWPQRKEGRIHLLDLLRKRLLFRREKMRKRHRRTTERYYSPTFCTVKELKNAGLWLKASETNCLTDISFKRTFFFGKLWLLPVSVDYSTINLMAYEMCPDFYNEFTVTSYMCFLDLLIDEAEDVKDLRDAGILYNRLGSDEEVAKLFNKMNTDLVPSPMIYSEVKWQIHNHCKNMWIKHAAQAYNTYFRSPWTFLAFVGAIAALLLSALQTYYTINQPNKDSSNHKN